MNMPSYHAPIHTEVPGPSDTMATETMGAKNPEYHIEKEPVVDPRTPLYPMTSSTNVEIGLQSAVE